MVESLSAVKQENKILCEALSERFNVNGNIITIDPVTRVVSDAYKGTIDEVNNGLYFTYGLHEQKFPLPVSRPVERDVHSKMLRAIRGILSQCSRTEHRIEIKKALRSDNIYEKIETLEKIVLSEIQDFGTNKAPKIDVHKFIAFQTIQFLGLLRYPSMEIFTKGEAGKLVPSAYNLLYRRDQGSALALDELQDRLIQGCRTLLNSKKTINILQDGKLIRTPFGRLDVLTEQYRPEI